MTSFHCTAPLAFESTTFSAAPFSSQLRKYKTIAGTGGSRPYHPQAVLMVINIEDLRESSQHGLAVPTGLPLNRNPSSQKLPFAATRVVSLASFVSCWNKCPRVACTSPQPKHIPPTQEDKGKVWNPTCKTRWQWGQGTWRW